MTSGKAVVIDANLLVLLVAGNADRRLIARHKNLNTYDADGFDLLVETLSRYLQVILIPNALAEASNLLRQTSDPDRSHLMRSLQNIIQIHAERYIVSQTAAAEATYVRLGLTDAALINAARQYGDLFSVDSKLCIAAGNEGIEALNFAHLYDAMFG